MSTVTLSKPHCATISAEKPEGIASHALTTALPDFQISLTLFATLPSFFVVWTFVTTTSAATARSRYYCQPDRCATVAMTQDLCSRPLDADFADADLASGVHYRCPGIIRQGDAVWVRPVRVFRSAGRPNWRRFRSAHRQSA